MYDTHCHLDYFENHREVIESAFLNNVDFLNSICVEIKKFDEILNIIEKYKNIFCSIGQHPLYIKDEKEIIKNTEIIEIKINKFKDKIVAIGETGLDYFKIEDKNLLDIQQKSFIEHIKISNKHNLPLVVHTRNAKEDTLRMLKKEKAKGLIHCFTEDLDFLKKVLDLGFYVSFSGIVTFKNAIEIQNCAKYCPLDRILIETDAPYLSPIPFRGKQNKPEYIKFIAEFLANIKNIAINNFINTTTQNALQLFNIKV